MLNLYVPINMLNRKNLLIGILSVLIVLTLLNPSEERYLNRVAMDYGKIHEDMTIGAKELIQMGSSQKSNYVLFSTYTYTFGNLKVQYWGILNVIFYSGSGSSVEKSVDRWS